MTSVATTGYDTSARRPRARGTLAGISPYEPGMSPETAALRFGAQTFAKLSSNENPFGPSPRAIEAAMAALAHPETYPDSTSTRLRRALATHLDVAFERVAAGPGSEALIDYFFRAYFEPGDALLLSRPTFPSYEIFARSAGAQIVDVPRTAGYDLDIEAIRAALRRRPKALALCTPQTIRPATAPRAPTWPPFSTRPRWRPSSSSTRPISSFTTEGGGLDLLEAWGGVFLLYPHLFQGLWTGGFAGRLRRRLRAGGHRRLPDRLRPAFNLTTVSQAAAIAGLADQGSACAGERRRSSPNGSACSGP